jgi:hypothetical protein
MTKLKLFVGYALVVGTLNAVWTSLIVIANI